VVAAVDGALAVGALQQEAWEVPLGRRSSRTRPIDHNRTAEPRPHIIQDLLREVGLRPMVAMLADQAVAAVADRAADRVVVVAEETVVEVGTTTAVAKASTADTMGMVPKPAVAKASTEDTVAAEVPAVAMATMATTDMQVMVAAAVAVDTHKEVVPAEAATAAPVLAAVPDPTTTTALLPRRFLDPA